MAWQRPCTGCSALSVRPWLFLGVIVAFGLTRAHLAIRFQNLRFGLKLGPAEQLRDCATHGIVGRQGCPHNSR